MNIAAYKKKTFLLVGLVLGSAVPFIAYAQYQLPGNFGLSSREGAIATISYIVSFFASLLAVLAILMIIIAGVMYIVSAGDQTRIETAKKILTYAIIGLIVALLAWVIVNVVSDVLGAGDGRSSGNDSLDICFSNPTLGICANIDL